MSGSGPADLPLRSSASPAVRSDAETTALIMADLRRKSRHLISAEELLLNNISWQGKRRTDFWTLTPNQSSGFATVGYEVKVSRADFRRDSLEKQKHALRYSNRFYYLTPAGLVTSDECPEWAGLIWWTPPEGRKSQWQDPFSYRKPAPKRDKEEPDWLFVSTLLRSGKCERDDPFGIHADRSASEDRTEQSEAHHETD